MTDDEWIAEQLGWDEVVNVEQESDRMKLTKIKIEKLADARLKIVDDNISAQEIKSDINLNDKETTQND